MLRAILAQAGKTGIPIVIEATGNQVNKDGGYTEMTPKEFMSWVKALANQAGFPMDQLILGGDQSGEAPVLKRSAHLIGKTEDSRWPIRGPGPKRLS